MQQIGRKSFFVVILLTVFALSIIPLEKIRLGKDLRGGTTLIYQLEIEPGEDASRVVINTIEVLKERIDPNGLYDITIVPQGRDRLEITMPLPSDEMKALKKAFTDELEQFAKISLTRSVIEDAFELAEPDRATRVKELGGGNAKRETLLATAVVLHDEHRVLKKPI